MASQPVSHPACFHSLSCACAHVVSHYRLSIDSSDSRRSESVCACPSLFYARDGQKHQTFQKRHVCFVAIFYSSISYPIPHRSPHASLSLLSVVMCTVAVVRAYSLYLCCFNFSYEVCLSVSPCLSLPTIYLYRCPLSSSTVQFRGFYCVDSLCLPKTVTLVSPPESYEREYGY